MIELKIPTLEKRRGGYGAAARARAFDSAVARAERSKWDMAGHNRVSDALDASSCRRQDMSPNLGISREVLREKNG
jgi:hypothetical protein